MLESVTGSVTPRRPAVALFESDITTEVAGRVLIVSGRRDADIDGAHELTDTNSHPSQITVAELLR